MEKLKFAKDEGNDFYIELRKRVSCYFSENELPRTGDSKYFIKLAAYFLLTTIFYLLMINSLSVLSFLWWYFLLGVSIVLLVINVGHDASHGVAVKSKFWNKVIFEIVFNLQGSNAYVWGDLHHKNHSLHTFSSLSGKAPLRNTPYNDVSLLNWCFAPFQNFYVMLSPTVIQETLMVFNGVTRKVAISNYERVTFERFFKKLLYLGYMGVIPALILPVSWYVVLGAFVMLNLMVNLIMMEIFHANASGGLFGMVKYSYPKFCLKFNTNYHSQSRILKWFIGGLNTPVCHYLLPDVNHIYYPQMAPIVKDIAAIHGLPYEEVATLGGLEIGANIFPDLELPKNWYVQLTK